MNKSDFNFYLPEEIIAQHPAEKRENSRLLTLNKKTGHLMQTPDIVSRAFIYLDNSEELIGKIRHYLRQKTDKSISTDPEMKVLKEEIKEDITHILFDATGHTPIVIPVINKV